MGTWGHGSLENDDAADWTHEFEPYGIVAVREALKQVCKVSPEEYLEVPQASGRDCCCRDRSCGAGRRRIKPLRTGAQSVLQASTEPNCLASSRTGAEGNGAHPPLIRAEGRVVSG